MHSACRTATRDVRRRAVLAAALPLVAVGRRAIAAEFTLKLATGQTLSQPINVRLEQATNRIKEATGGRLDVRFFPASQLGSDTDLLSQVRSGGIDFLNIAGSVLSTIAPVAAIANIGFAFTGYGQIWPGMDGALGQFLRREIEKTGVIVVAKAADNGIRQITSASKAITAPEDLKGYRIRVPVSPIFTSLFTAFEASPTSINFNELYTSLQTRLVDGQENGLVAIESAKLYEVQKYVAETSHIWDPFWLLGNRRSFGRLPADVQETVRREFDRAAVEQRGDVAQLDTTLKAQLSARGLAFNPVDKAAFRGALAKAGFYRSWREKFGAEPWQALEAVAGPLA